MPVLQRGLNTRPEIKSGSVWKEHENVLQAAMKASDRWKNLADDGLSDKEIKATFFRKIPMKIFAWNSKRGKDLSRTPRQASQGHIGLAETTSCYPSDNGKRA